MMITISDKVKCSGCHACASVCPKSCVSMVPDAEGFCYPQVDESVCVHCGLCEQVCPILHPIPVEKQPVVYGAYNKNEEIRMQSFPLVPYFPYWQSMLSVKGVWCSEPVLTMSFV